MPRFLISKINQLIEPPPSARPMVDAKSSRQETPLGVRCWQFCLFVEVLLRSLFANRPCCEFRGTNVMWYCQVIYWKLLGFLSFPEHPPPPPTDTWLMLVLALAVLLTVTCWVSRKATKEQGCFLHLLKLMPRICWTCRFCECVCIAKPWQVNWTPPYAVTQ